MEPVDYIEKLFYNIERDLYKHIKLSKDNMKILYERGDINFWEFVPRQQFAYKLADLSMDNKCNLLDKYWLNGISWHKPELSSDHFKYGDLGGYDGQHIVSRDLDNIYKIIVKVKSESAWIFEFDKNNPESMNSFYDLFYDVLYKDYLNYILTKRLQEIQEQEISHMKRISESILNN